MPGGPFKGYNLVCIPQISFNIFKSCRNLHNLKVAAAGTPDASPFALLQIPTTGCASCTRLQAVFKTQPWVFERFKSGLRPTIGLSKIYTSCLDCLSGGCWGGGDASPFTCGSISPYSGRDCVKSLRSSLHGVVSPEVLRTTYARVRGMSDGLRADG